MPITPTGHPLSSILHSRLLLLTLLPTPTLAATLIADLQSDWSETANPNTTTYGTWTLRAGTTILPHVTHWAGDPPSNLQGYGPPDNNPGDFLPFFFKTPIPYGDSLPGDVIVHSWDSFNGTGLGDDSLRFTPSLVANVSVSLELWPIRYIGRANVFSLVAHPESPIPDPLASGTLVEDGTLSRDHPFTVSLPDVTLTPARSLELRIITATPAGDFTGIHLSITAIAFAGDANRNGTIDPDDFALTDRGAALHLTGWQNGDFNGDSTVNAADYLLLDTAYHQQGGHFSPTLLSERESQFGPAYLTQLLPLAPEPSLLACLSAESLLLLRPRRLRYNPCG